MDQVKKKDLILMSYVVLIYFLEILHIDSV